MTSSVITYQALELIAKEDINDLSFPTHFGVVLKLRAILSDPDSSFKKVIELLKGEPVIAAKVISSANTVGNGSGSSIIDIEKAVFRLGLNAVRRIALGVAMVQLNKSKEMLVFSNLARCVWLHSLYVSSAAYVVAKELSRLHPDEAEFSGLMLNLGAFYMLYRAASSEGSMQHDDVREGVVRHYLALSKKLLQYLEIPQETIDAISIDKQQAIEIKSPPKTMRELIHVANELATVKMPWFDEDRNREEIPGEYTSLKGKIDSQFLLTQQMYR